MVEIMLGKRNVLDSETEFMPEKCGLLYIHHAHIVR